MFSFPNDLTGSSANGFDPQNKLMDQLNERSNTIVLILGVLISLAVFGILFMMVFDYRNPKALGPTFMLWAAFGAFASTACGNALGLLFGLPTVRKVEINNNQQGDTSNSGTSGYVESSSLEQIADWLTKIIVGLTLTQYREWSAGFNTLSMSLTDSMMQCSKSCNPTPGATIIIGYSIFGFIVAYLWMRRYFIPEMQRQKKESETIASERKVIDAAKLAGNIQLAPTAKSGTEKSDLLKMKATEIVESGKVNPPSTLKAAVENIKPGSDPDDPWRGVFGKSPSDTKAVLSATISELESSSKNCQIDLVVAGLGPENQKTLSGHSALFYLHPTFGPKPRMETFGVDGRATLSLVGYGAFTVGVLLEDGSKLELNLAEIPGIPESFRVG